MEEVAKLANCIYGTGPILDQIARSVFITIPKKPGATDSGKFRTISAMSQLSKLVLKVVLNRTRNKNDLEIPEELYGFPKRNAKFNAIFVIRMIRERSLDMQKDLFMCFTD